MGKKVFLLLLSLVVLIIFTVSNYDYNTILNNKLEDSKNEVVSRIDEYKNSITSKFSEIKNDIFSKIGLDSDEGNTTSKKPLNFELLKQDGVVLMNGVFKNEEQANEVAELLNINRTGTYSFESNRVKDVMLLNKISSIMISFKDFFLDGSKLSIEDGKVLLNGELKDSNYKALFDSIVLRTNLDIISNIKEPTALKAEELVKDEKLKIQNEDNIESVEKVLDEKIDNTVADMKEKEELAVISVKNEIKEQVSLIKTTLNSTKTIKNDEFSNLSQKSKQIQSNINGILSNKKINFKRRSTTITKDSYIAVKEIASILKDNKNIKVEIAGHTDSRGKSSLNKRISQDRSNSVKTALIALGVNKAQLAAVGYGEDFPIAKDDANGLSEVNRRVEFNIIGE